MVAEHPDEIDNEILAEGRDRGSIGCIADIVRAVQFVHELEKFAVQRRRTGLIRP